MSRLKKWLGKYLRKFYYAKLAYGRSYSYIGIFKGWFDDVVRFAILFKVSGYDNYGLLVILGVLFIVFMVTIGHFEIKSGFAKIETSVNNQIDPELMSIFKNAGGKEVELAQKERESEVEKLQGTRKS